MIRRPVLLQYNDMTAKEAQAFVQGCKFRLSGIKKVVESAGLQVRVATYVKGRWANQGPIFEVKFPRTNRCVRAPLPVQDTNDEGFAVFLIQHTQQMSKVSGILRLQ